MYKYRKGLVVGKFSPLHFGHVYLINTALEQCEKVVIITYSNPEFEGCSPEEVTYWLSVNFQGKHSRITTIVPNIYSIPSNDADDYTQRDFCANLLEDHGITVDALFTSETYGDGFAKFLTRRFHGRVGFQHQPSVEHVCVDINRTIYPTSGTAIRSSDILKSKYVAHGVKPSFVPRVAFLGGESSGKTTLVNEVSKVIADSYNVGTVMEYGRSLYEATGGKLIYDDMLLIARTQVSLERTAASALVYDIEFEQRKSLLLCDTTPATTLWYSTEWYKGYDIELYKLAKRKYDLTIICANDFKFVQDGTRIDAEFRQAAFDWYIGRQESLGLPYIIVTGTIEERVKQVLAAINAM